MTRKLVGCCALSVALGLACQSAAAAERKSVSRSQAGVLETMRAQAFKVGAQTGGRARAEQVEGSTRDYKDLTFFRFRSSLGEVAVQPVMGRVNGAQFSVGF